jgi:hypothetical protein
MRRNLAVRTRPGEGPESTPSRPPERVPSVRFDPLASAVAPWPPPSAPPGRVVIAISRPGVASLNRSPSEVWPTPNRSKKLHAVAGVAAVRRNARAPLARRWAFLAEPDAGQPDRTASQLDCDGFELLDDPGCERAGGAGPMPTPALLAIGADPHDLAWCEPIREVLRHRQQLGEIANLRLPGRADDNPEGFRMWGGSCNTSSSLEGRRPRTGPAAYLLREMLADARFHQDYTRPIVWIAENGGNPSGLDVTGVDWQSTAYRKDLLDVLPGCFAVFYGVRRG